MVDEHNRRFVLGKYREIVLAVACFLVFDLAVLILNFYISYQMSASAVEINLAGRQRMLSQRMTKELLLAQQQDSLSEHNGWALDSLAKTTRLFDSTLVAFRVGGEAVGGDGKPVHVTMVGSEAGIKILADAEQLWAPLREILLRLQASPKSPGKLDEAVTYASAHNDELLKLMNSLTTELEQAANARANLLRMVQTGGIALALLNFAFILFKFIRRLRDYDSRIEKAHRETDEILATVREGLFLLDADFLVGSQFSRSLPAIMGVPVAENTDFRAVLRQLLPADECKAACEYVELLFRDKVKESLVQSLNPLNHLHLPGDGGESDRYLTLQFNRVLVEGRISHLLVTVFDITAQVELEQELSEARKKAKAEVEVMLDLLKVNPSVLRQFLDGAERVLLEINDALRSLDGERDYRRLIAHVFRQIHSLKGDAAALGLELFEETAQQFETLLAGLRSKGMVTGADLLALPLPLDEFLQRISTVRSISRRLATYHESFQAEAEAGGLQTLVHGMQQLVQRIAGDQEKSVSLETELSLVETLPVAAQTQIKEIILQLLRNAVVHGLETAAERAVLQKPPVGQLSLVLRQEGGEFMLVVRDDGRGLVPARIRDSLLQAGVYTAAQLAEFSDQQLIMKIFDAGVSTAGVASRDAGHGVGMDVVKHKIQQLGARLHIATRPDAYTQFSIRFAV